MVYGTQRRYRPGFTGYEVHEGGEMVHGLQDGLLLSAATLLSAMMFFILGILTKIVLSFRSGLRQDLKDLKGIFFAHEHKTNGSAYVPCGSDTTKKGDK